MPTLGTDDQLKLHSSLALGPLIPNRQPVYHGSMRGVYVLTKHSCLARLILGLCLLLFADTVATQSLGKVLPIK